MTGTGLAAPLEGREVVNCPECLRVVRTGRMRGRESTMTVSYGRGYGLSLSKVCQDGGIFSMFHFCRLSRGSDGSVELGLVAAGSSIRVTRVAYDVPNGDSRPGE